MAGSFVGLLAVQAGDSPEVSSSKQEGGNPGGEEGTEGSVGNNVIFADVLATSGGTSKAIVTTLVVHSVAEQGSVDDQHSSGSESSEQQGPEELHK